MDNIGNSLIHIGNELQSDVSIFDILDKYFSGFLGVVLLIFCCVWCFFGFKIFKVYVAITGFFIGAIIGVGIDLVVIMQIAKPSKVVLILMVLLSLFVGIIGALIAYKVYAIGVFFIGFSTSLPISFILSCILSGTLSNGNVTVTLTLTVILCIVVGIVAVILKKPMIIILTSVQYGLQAGMYLSCLTQHSKLMLLFGIVFSVAGILVQRAMNNGLLERPKSDAVNIAK